MELPIKKTSVDQEMRDNIFLFYGPVGVGKTYFVNQLFPAVLFLSTDRGTRDKKALRVEVHDADMLEKALRLLEKSKTQYDAVCFDNLTDICYMLEDTVLRELNATSLGEKRLWGAGWAAYRKAIFRVVHRVMKLDLVPIFIAHDTVEPKGFRGRDVDCIKPKMPKGALDNIVPMCSFIGYCTQEQVRLKDKSRVLKRFLYCQPTEQLEAKDRTNRPGKPDKEKEPLDAASFKATFERSTETDAD